MASLTAEPELSTLESAWQSIATLKLALGNAVCFHRHQYRGSPWLIIANKRNESYFRCSYHAEKFLTLLDGSRTVEQALVESHQPNRMNLVRQDVIMLIANLKSAGVLDDKAALTGGADHSSSKPVRNRWLNPFAIKFPLLDPDRFLNNTVHLVKPLFNHVALFLWLAIVLTGSVTLVLNWHGLSEHSASRFTDPKNLLWYWFLYPIVKGLHEFGHAYATKIWGGAVREMGITFLVFFPVPYVDSSASHSFESKSRRMVVCGSGIMIELLLAAVALLVWTYTDPGFIRDLAFDVAVIAGISTLLFNANPLLRFDGYYLLCELIETPNLGTRSDQYLGYLFKRYVLDMPEYRSPVSAAGEAKWLIAYGICARIYRVFISFFIAFWVAGKFLIIGVFLAVWALVAQLFYPLFRAIWSFIPEVVQANRVKRLLGFVSVISIVFATTIMTPMGHSTYSEGVVNLPEHAFIRAQTDGVITHVNSYDGTAVENGDLILKLEDIELDAHLQTLVARLNELRALQQSVFLSDRTQSEILNDKAAALDADIQNLKTQQSQLNVVSGSSGSVSLPLGSDLVGRHVKRGDVLGYVAGNDKISALVAIPQLDIDDVRNDLSSIEVKLGSRPEDKYIGEFVRELPLATDRLPNRLLGSSAGGSMPVDARDESGLQLLSNVFLVEIELPLATSGSYLGQRIHVRFIHQKESLGARYMRKISQLIVESPYSI